MPPEVGQAGFRIGFFIIMVAVILLIFTKPGTAEFVMSQITLIIGLVFTAVLLLMQRILK